MRKAITLFGLLAVLLLLGACEEGGYTVYPTQPVPTIYPPIGPNGTNATKQEFDQYRNKWRSSGVRQYRIEVEYGAYSEFMGTWTLDVETNGDTAKVVKYARDPKGAPGALGDTGSADAMPTTTEGVQYVKDSLAILTVETMFDTASGYVDGTYREDVETQLQFDPSLGYLKLLVARRTPQNNADHSDMDWKIIKLEILSRETPTP